MTVIYSLLFTLLANAYALIERIPWLLMVVLPLFLWINLFAGLSPARGLNLRMQICAHGGMLLRIFAWSMIVSLAFHAALAVLPHSVAPWLVVRSAILCACFEAILFWNGILCVYCTSFQLGVHLRVLGALCGMIPILNLVLLRRIVSTVVMEVDVELERAERNAERAEALVCRTRYPILLVHGVFFRDSAYFNYWGRIPEELERNGATVYYGEHASAKAVRDSAAELSDRIRRLVRESGCEKVNIIAHSKGGLDCRCAITDPEIAALVASLTTVNTPHRGCVFAERLLNTAPESLKNGVAQTYNATLSHFGDQDPDFLCAVSDLTAKACERFNAEWETPKGILYQSIGSRLNRATAGRFPLNLSYRFVKQFDGSNDGLVGEDSFAWGDSFRLLTVSGKRGISHGDVIDLNRENIDGFDVREFYVELVSQLKERGL